MMSLFLFACCLFAMPLASSLILCTSTIALAGICRAVIAWVPFALLGHEITDSIQQDSWDEPLGESQKSTTGSLVGIHNLAMALPQIFATIEAAIIFCLLGSQSFTEDVVVGGSFELVVYRLWEQHYLPGSFVRMLIGFENFSGRRKFSKAYSMNVSSLNNKRLESNLTAVSQNQPFRVTRKTTKKRLPVLAGVEDHIGFSDNGLISQQEIQKQFPNIYTCIHSIIFFR